MVQEVYTKNVGDIFRAVKRQFGDESGVQITDEDISRWVDDAQSDIIVNNSDVNASFAQINVIANQTAYPIKDHVANVFIIQSIHYNGEYLRNMSFQEAQAEIIKKTQPGEHSGVPMFWYERAGVIHLFPKPASSISAGLGVFYSARPTAITGNTTPLSVPDHFFSTIVNYCLSQAYLLDENAQMAQITSQNYDTAMAQRVNRTQSEHNTYPTITPVDDY